MRQAGRSLPEYRALRTKYTIDQLFRTAELIAEVTLQPTRRFPLDAAILFSDILMLLDLFGISWSIVEGRGPVIPHPLREAKEVENLLLHPVERTLPFLQEAIKGIRAQSKLPLIGFAGSPFSVAAYFIEGQGSHTWAKVRAFLYKHPLAFEKLIDRFTEGAIALLESQWGAGCHLLQLFESHGHWLPPPLFQRYCAEPIQKIYNHFAHQVPLLVFCRNTSHWAPYLCKGADGLSVDWQSDVAKLRQEYPHLILQGNLDPALLYAPPEMIHKEVSSLLTAMKGDKRYIFNLGHGMLPDVSVDAIATCIESVKTFSYGKSFPQP